MSSGSKKTKTDLIVRVRYQNPLPPPPFPPRFLNITTSPDRYATYDFLNPMMNERELPLSLDTELGMPIELGKIRPGEFGDGKYWMGNRAGICPVGPPTAILDDEDAFLMDSVITQAPSAVAGSSSVVIPPGGHVVVGVERKKLDVSWLRRTEYLSSEGGKMMPGANTAPTQSQETVEITRDARTAAVVDSFAPINGPLSELRHPTKKHLTAAKAWNVLPDAELWVNDSALVRFGEDPGEGKGGMVMDRIGEDPRLHRAKFRNVEIPGEERRIGYYLPTDDAAAQEYGLRRLAANLDFLSNNDLPPIEFDHLRDYETATSRALKAEYVFAIVNGPPGEGEEVAAGVMPSMRSRGAFFTPLSDVSTLRKRRYRRNENFKAFPEEMVDAGRTFWDGMGVQLGGLDSITPEEVAARREKLAEVLAP